MGVWFLLNAVLRDRQSISKKVLLYGAIALVFFMGIKACTFVLEPDYFWHVKLGNWMIQNKQIMTQDVYSWVSAAQPLPEFAHSWLGSIILAIFHNVFSSPGSPYLGAFVYEVTFFAVLLIVLFFALRKKIPSLGNGIMGSVVLVFAPAMLAVQFTPRPQMIGNILFTLMLAVLSSWDESKNKLDIYWLPVISLVWVNAHGGTAPMLLAFCGAYLVCGFISMRAGQITSVKRSKQSLVHLSVATGLSAAAMLINPYGYKIYTYGFVFNNAACKTGVAEWQPTTIYSGMGIFLIAVFIVILLLSNRTFKLSSLIPVVSMAALTMIYVRGTPYLGIALSFFVAANMQPNHIIEDVKPAKNKLWVFVCILAVISISSAVATHSSLMTEAADSEFVVSQEIITSIKENGYERLFNDYNAGGYLIYSDILVFIDSRADLYPEDVLRDGKNFQYWNCDANEVISKYDFDGFLIANSTTIFGRVEK